MPSDMTGSRLPERLTLDELPLAANAFRGTSCQRGMQILVLEGTVDDLIEAIKENEGAQVSLGKRPAIILGEHKARLIKPVDEDHCYVYKRRPGERKAQFTAAMSLKDAVSRAKAAGSQDLDMNDPALLSLQQSLAEHAQKRQANTTVFVKDSSKLPPAVSGREAARVASRSNKLLKPHRQGLFDQNKTARSLPASPSLSGMTPIPSKLTAKQLRQDALKTSLIHLLALRAVSEQYITKTLNCSESDVKDLLDKYGRPSRLDARKFDLSDRGFKELDVWSFGYKDSSDRQAAIDHAIAAFDRQRISVREHVWQMLLPKEERGKGKILSKLHFYTGPVERVKTPQIHVQSTSETGTNGKTSPGDERPGRLAPNSASGPRSSSQDPPNKSKVSEKEAQAKRLLSKPKITNGTNSVPASMSNAKMAAKKQAAKAAPSSNSKFKSAEYIVDSDDDDNSEIGDVVEVARPSSKSSKSVPKPKETERAAPPSTSRENPIAKSNSTAPTKSTGAKKPTVASSSSGKLKPSDAEIKASSTQTFVRNRATSSPSKPSRLGSSPPTNASDLENEIFKSKSSSSSNSPLINQRREIRKPLPIPTAPRTVASDGNLQHTLKRKVEDGSEQLRSSGRLAGSERERERDREIEPPPAKRRQPSPPVKHRSVTPSDTAATGTSQRNQSAGGALSSEHLQSARRFKERQLQYSRLLREVRGISNPSAERIQKLRQMYSKLSEHKRSLLRLAST